ncbi:MAG TPA: ATP-binding protein [Stellaceae bacterium]
MRLQGTNADSSRRSSISSNAIKFTGPGGAIRIEAKRCEGEMLLTVADTGIGTPLSARDRMVEKSEWVPPRSGAGFGLSLVKRLIELHGGTVTIDAAAGRGTTITCHLPTGPREFVTPILPQMNTREAA